MTAYAHFSENLAETDREELQKLADLARAQFVLEKIHESSFGDAVSAPDGAADADALCGILMALSEVGIDPSADDSKEIDEACAAIAAGYYIPWPPVSAVVE